MLDIRIKRQNSAVNWRYQEIKITEQYLREHALDPFLIELDAKYEMGIKGLDVYFNGQRLLNDIKYPGEAGIEEVDEKHIRVHIGTEEVSPGVFEPIPYEVGDVIIIKEWFNSDSILYSYQGINDRIYALEVEVTDARGTYDKVGDRLTGIDTTVSVVQTEVVDSRGSHARLPDRLDGMAGELANLLGEGDYNIEYVYDPNGYDIVKEIVTGDYNIVKDYVYNSYGKPTKEVITAGGKIVTRLFQYAQDGRLSSVIANTVKI